LPFLTRTYHLNFYGGEPLLAFDLIRRTISLLSEKNKGLDKRPIYSLTTNGSLLTPGILRFLDQHRFQVELSFDGYAQDIQRKKGTFQNLVSATKQLLEYNQIDLETNSVFTPQTIGHLSKSMTLLMNLGLPNIRFSLSTIEPWDEESLAKLEDEMEKLRRSTLSLQKRYRRIPITNFRENREKGIFFCAAGQDRLSLSPDGKIWGCYLFADYFKGKEDSAGYEKYFFGSLEKFIQDHKKIYPRISKNYSQLSMDNFATPSTRCFLCPELESCAVCPVNASFSGLPLGKIPAHLCEIQKIRLRILEKYGKELKATT
jgi:sulfatase maturation enzyme AslB (radical SAM superfamily)